MTRSGATSLIFPLPHRPDRALALALVWLCRPRASARWTEGKARLGLILVYCLALPLVRGEQTTATRQEPSSVRFCMSSRLFREVNENDARASVRVYAKQVAESRGLIADPNPRIFSGTAELTHLLSSEEVDLVSMPTEEYLELGENLVTGPILISLVDGADYEEYALLVRADGGFNQVSDLKGHRVLVLDSLQASLADCWLEVLLGNEKLRAPGLFFSGVTRTIKVTQAVLPVFFHQADACIVTRQGFALMGELNPQVSKQLRVLATSPQVVPHLTCFRAGFNPALRVKLVEAVTEAHTNPAGRQLLTIFQCDRIEARLPSKLRSTMELLAARARQRGGPTL
jgi:ABC-type phosphate/phosphonate transport system substrate-binding protein